MRIVSGNNKGRKLYAPHDMTVRPTSDKIKQAIFNMLKEIDGNSIVLDLFAGTGNVGIEFLARGAEKCYFVDISYKSLSFVKKNVELCNLKEKSIIIKNDYEKAILYFAKQNIKFDYIFVDPPYNMNCGSIVLKSIIKNKILNKNGLIIIEGDKSENLFENIDENTINCKEKIYGRTNISIINMLEDK